MCFVDTWRSTVGVTADHCYRGYLKYKAKVGHEYREVYCQIGGLVIPRIEEHLCSRDAAVDLATFFISPILMEEIRTCSSRGEQFEKCGDVVHAFRLDSLNALRVVTRAGRPPAVQHTLRQIANRVRKRARHLNVT
jgi:hypothetical protein